MGGRKEQTCEVKRITREMWMQFKRFDPSSAGVSISNYFLSLQETLVGLKLMYRFHQSYDIVWARF